MSTCQHVFEPSGTGYSEGVRYFTCKYCALVKTQRLQHEGAPAVEPAPGAEQEPVAYKIHDASGVEPLCTVYSAHAAKHYAGHGYGVTKLYAAPVSPPGDERATPEGFVLVPRKLTDEMRAAARDKLGFTQMYEAAIAATPAAQAVEPAGQRAVGDWQHAANEWADAATNGIQWLKDIEAGNASTADAVASLTRDIEHARASQPSAGQAAAGPVDAATLLAEMVKLMDDGDEHGAGSDWHTRARAALAAPTVAAAGPVVQDEPCAWVKLNGALYIDFMPNVLRDEAIANGWKPVYNRLQSLGGEL